MVWHESYHCYSNLNSIDFTVSHHVIGGALEPYLQRYRSDQPQSRGAGELWDWLPRWGEERDGKTQGGEVKLPPRDTDSLSSTIEALFFTISVTDLTCEILHKVGIIHHS
jgi:hypothetical protein